LNLRTKISLLQTGLSKEFRKAVHRVHDDSSHIVVHYLGKASIATDYPHGNNSKQPISYRQQMSSMLACMIRVTELLKSA